MATTEEMQIDSTPVEDREVNDVQDRSFRPVKLVDLALTDASVILSNLDLIHLAVQQFDVRFIFRALRGISSIRKNLPNGQSGRSKLEAVRTARRDGAYGKAASAITKSKVESGEFLDEEDIYLNLLEIVRKHGQTRGHKQRAIN